MSFSPTLNRIETYGGGYSDPYTCSKPDCEHKEYGAKYYKAVYNVISEVHEETYACQEKFYYTQERVAWGIQEDHIRECVYK